MWLSPKSPLPQVNRTSIRFERSEYHGVFADIETAIGRDPKFVMADRLRADIYREKGLLERARGEDKTALMLGPTDKQRAAIESNSAWSPRQLLR